MKGTGCFGGTLARVKPPYQGLRGRILAQGGTMADACRRIGVTEQSYYRRARSGGLKMDQARRTKELEGENPSCGKQSQT
jgi:hypothetical protein